MVKNCVFMKKTISNILHKLEEESKTEGNPYWIISHSTGKFLNDLIMKNNIKRALEVGTSIGYSGIWLAEALMHTGGKLYTIESHNERFEKAKKHFNEAGLLDYVVQLKGHAPDVQINEMFDFLFLDATKSEYVNYLVAYLFHMKKGGIIAADNALTHQEELKEYSDYIFSSPYLESKLIEEGNGIYLSRIVKSSA